MQVSPTFRIKKSIGFYSVQYCLRKNFGKNMFSKTIKFAL